MKELKKLSPASPLASGEHLQSNRYFFNSSKTAAAQITDLFDFIWPTLTALWNLRWEVSGYLYVRGNEVSKEELNARFCNNEKINRPNLYRSCIEFSWEKQKEDFAKIILINLFAFHESWVENILNELEKNAHNRIKGMQFPSMTGKQGVFDILNDLLSSRSSELTDAFYSVYASNKKYGVDKLNNLLICYRYFKECRNCFMHAGGITSKHLAEASALYAALDAGDLNTNVKPEATIFKLNDKVDLKIEGVVGFADIILQIITTIDAELIQSIEAEKVFFSRIRNFLGNKPAALDPLPRVKAKKMKSILQQSGFAIPTNMDAAESLMRREGLIK